MTRSMVLFLLFFSGVGLIHALAYYLANDSLAESQILASYTFQGFTGVCALGLLLLSAHKIKDQIGFVFMGLSFLKFVLYFVLFHPRLMADGILSLSEKIEVLIPYLTALILETVLGLQNIRKI